MSTYTDLHNKVKESVNVDFRSRVTPQKVRMLNEENEYWGTFKGTMVADGIEVKGGVLNDVQINHSTLSDVYVKTKDGSTIDLNTLANDVQELSGIAFEEIPAIHDEIKHLSSEISSNDTKFDTKIYVLQDQIDDLSNTLSTEIDDRISADDSICELMGEVSSQLSLDYVGKVAAEASLRENEAFLREKYDKLIKEDLSTEISARISSDESLSLAFTCALAHDKHYTIHPVDTTRYPFATTEFAINIVEGELVDAYVFDKNTNQRVGKIVGTVDDFTFTAFSNCGEAYKVAVVPGYGYVFKDGISQIYTINSYQLVLEKGSTFATSKLTLQPTATSYYPVTWIERDLSGEITAKPGIGRVTGAMCTANNRLLSGYMTVSTTDSMLADFNVQYAEFNDSTKTDISVGGNNVITYLGDNTFDFKKNVTEYNYLALSDQLAEPELIFGKVYDTDVDFDGETLHSIKIKFSDRTSKIQLDENNGFKVELSGDLSSTTYLSCTPDYKIHERKEAIQYKYGFYDRYDTEFAEKFGYITLTDYNVKLSDDFVCTISADLKEVEKIPALKSVYELTKIPGEPQWGTTQTVEGNDISVSFVKTGDRVGKLYVDIITAEQHSLIQKEFNVDQQTDVIAQDKSEDILKSQAINFVYDQSELAPATLFEVVLGKRVDEVGPTFVLNPKSEDTNVVKLQIEDKKFDDISREEIIVTKLTTDVPGVETVQLKFVDEDCKDIKVYNEKSLEFKVPTNAYTTVKIQEVQQNVFLLTDLNENSQEGRIAKLRQDLLDEIAKRGEDDTYLSGQIDDLSGDVVKLSGDVEELIIRDHKDVTYLGEMLSVDDHEDHHLSCFLRKQPRWFEKDDYVFHYGFMYRLSAEQANLIDKNDKHVYLGVNDYMLFNKDQKLSDVTFDDFNLIRDTQDEVRSVEKWVSDNFAKLSGNNEIKSVNTFTGSLSAVDFDADRADVDQLSAKALTGTSFSSESAVVTDLTVTHKLTVKEEETEAYVLRLSAESARLSNSSLCSTNISTAKVDDADILDLSAAKATVNNLTADSLANIQIAGRSKSLQDILDLSVDNLSTQISATSCYLSAADFYLSSEISANDNDISYISGEVSANDGDISYLSGTLSDMTHRYKEKTMSCDIELRHDVPGKDDIHAKVDKLLIVDEVTFDLYALTICNGALNINKVKTLTEDYE